MARGYLTESQLAQALSRQLSVPWVALQHVDFSRQLLARVPRDVAETHGLIPVFLRHVKGQGETLYVAMDDPTNDDVLAAISELTKLPTRPMIAATSDIRNAIRAYYGGDATMPSSESSSASAATVTRPQAAQGSQPDDGEPSTKRTKKTAPADAPREHAAEASGTRALSLTLLDGTTIALPSPDRGGPRTRSRGATASQKPSRTEAPARESNRAEAVVQAVVSLLVRKGLISEREFADELKKRDPNA